jgi:hypothetical protein
MPCRRPLTPYPRPERGEGKEASLARQGETLAGAAPVGEVREEAVLAWLEDNPRRPGATSHACLKVDANSKALTVVIDEASQARARGGGRGQPRRRQRPAGAGGDHATAPDHRRRLPRDAAG